MNNFAWDKPPITDQRYPNLADALPLLMQQTWKNASLFGGNGWVSFEHAEYYLRIAQGAFASGTKPVVLSQPFV